jgi:hypothetical protein
MNGSIVFLHFSERFCGIFPIVIKYFVALIVTFSDTHRAFSKTLTGNC